MGLSTKQKISVLENAADLLDELVQETAAILPQDQHHITDRHDITVAEIRGVCECLRQKGVIDAEVEEVMSLEVA